MEMIVYAGTDEGLVTLRGSDAHHLERSQHALKEWDVPALIVDPAVPNRVLAGTRGDGVWLSEDFGET